MRFWLSGVCSTSVAFLVEHVSTAMMNTAVVAIIFSLLTLLRSLVTESSLDPPCGSLSLQLVPAPASSSPLVR